VIFVEGLFDAIALHQSGLTNVCSGIAASFSGEQINCLAKNGITKVWHLGDPDGGGENGTKSNLKRLLTKGIDVFVPEKLPACLDPDDFVNEHGVDALKDRIAKAEHGLSWLAKNLVSKYDLTLPDSVGNILRESAKIKYEYLKLGINPLLFECYFIKTLKSILDIENSEFNMNFEVEREKLEEQIRENLEAVAQWEPYEIALRLSEKYRDQLAYDSEIQEWRRYGAEHDDVWSVEENWSVANVIGAELYQLSFKFADPNTGIRPNVSANFVSGIITHLKAHLGKKKWHKPDPHLLPLLNGVLDLRTKQLLSHCQSNNLTWVLPYEYNPIAICKRR